MLALALTLTLAEALGALMAPMLAMLAMTSVEVLGALIPPSLPSLRRRSALAGDSYLATPKSP